MITLRRSDDRGHFDFGWLDTRHSFSFGEYHDPAQMGFRSLRVINEDRVAGGGGFPTHAHRDMEIITYVLSGAIEHTDSTGGGGLIRPGDVQKMSAGRGVQHSEYNPSPDEAMHLLQIWIIPDQRGIEPYYEQQSFSVESRRNTLRLVGAPAAATEGRPTEDHATVTLYADAAMYAALLDPGAEVRHSLGAGRGAWVQLARGAVELNGQRLEAGDGAAVEDEAELVLRGVEDAELLLFDLG